MTTPNPHRPEREVLRADPRLRQQTLLALLIFIVIGVVILVGLERHLQGLVADANAEPETTFRRVFQLMRIAFTIGGLGLVMCGAYLGRFAMRILAAEQFPPPGARVMHDTSVLRGSAARRHGRIMAALSILLLVMGLALPWIPDLFIRPMVESLPPAPPPIPERSIVEPVPAGDRVATGQDGYFDFGISATGPGPSSFSSVPTRA